MKRLIKTILMITLVSTILLSTMSFMFSDEERFTSASWSNTYQTLSDLQSASDIIIKGYLISSIPEQRHDLVFSKELVGISQVIKGTIKSNNVEILQTGGNLNGLVTPPIESAPLLRKNTEYLMYLQYVKDEQYGEYYLITGGDQGLFEMSKDGELVTYADVSRSLINGGLTKEIMRTSTDTPMYANYWLSNPRVWLSASIVTNYSASVNAKVVSAMYSWNDIGTIAYERELNSTSANVLVFMNDYGNTGWDGQSVLDASGGVYSFVHISLNNRGQAGDDLTFWQAVACHEFGHGLGLMHNDWTTVPSVMRDGTPAYHPNPGYYTPQQADRNAISGRYWQ